MGNRASALPGKGFDPTRPEITAIIPAYNESGRIQRVLSVALQAQFISKILVVDDGSTDGMADEVLRLAEGNLRLDLIRHKTNLGKGQALLTGWRSVRSPILLLLDADLINLSVTHLEALVLPVVRGEADMTLALFNKGYFWTDLSHHLTPWLSGQRCLRTSLMKRLPAQAAYGYGFETSLTVMARREKWRVKPVRWEGVTHPMGALPRGGISGFERKTRMVHDILRAWMLVELGWSWAGMRRYDTRRNR